MKQRTYLTTLMKQMTYLATLPDRSPASINQTRGGDKEVVTDRTFTCNRVPTRKRSVRSPSSPKFPRRQPHSLRGTSLLAGPDFFSQPVELARVYRRTALEDHPNAELGSEWNSDRRAGAEEISQRTLRDFELFQAEDGTGLGAVDNRANPRDVRGLLRLKMLKNSANGLICQRSPILNGRVTRRSVCK
jgi:hypothetical protein